MANLRLTFSDLYTRVSSFLGLTDTTTAPTGDDLTVCKDICTRGLRQFLYPINAMNGEYHEWTFLTPLYTMNLIADKFRYSLPADFSSIVTDPTYGEDENFKQMNKVSPQDILNLIAAGVVEYAPSCYAITTSTYDPEVGEVDEIMFYPKPDSSYVVQFYYKSDPLKPVNAADYLPGGVRSVEAILESCLSVAEIQEDDVIGIHTQLAQKLVQELINIDIKRDNNTRLGNLYSRSNGNTMLRSDRSTLTFYPDD